MDRNQADLAFIEIVETWLREQLVRRRRRHLSPKWCLQEPGETVDADPQDPTPSPQPTRR